MFNGDISTKNSKKNDTLIAVDIGSSKVRILAGKVLNQGLVDVIYYKEGPSSGLVSGSVSDLEALGNSLTNLTQDFVKQTSLSLDNCIVSIAGLHIQSKNEEGTGPVPSKVVTVADKENAIKVARAVTLNEGFQILHVIPQSFAIEDFAEITNPVGLSGMRLKVLVHLIACSQDAEANLKSAITRVDNSNVGSVVFSGIAAADAVLDDNEKEIGVCLINIGSGTVDVAVYDRNKLIISFGLDRGGLDITRAIAAHFGISLQIAEQIKIKYGFADPRLYNEEDPIKNISYISSNGQRVELAINLIDLSELISVHINNLFSHILNRIEDKTRTMKTSFNLGSGFVLTGGVANTKGIEYLASYSLSTQQPNLVKVRVGAPQGVQGEYAQSIIKPDCAVALGLVRFSSTLMDQKQESEYVDANGSRLKKIIRKFKEWYSNEL